MITFDYEGGRGVLANDYVIKNIRIFHKFLQNYVSDFQNSLRIRSHKLGHIKIKYFS